MIPLKHKKRGKHHKVSGKMVHRPMRPTELNRRRRSMQKLPRLGESESAVANPLQTKFVYRNTWSDFPVNN